MGKWFIDPGLTNLAVTKGTGGGFASEVISPQVQVVKPSGEYHTFLGNEALTDDVETEVALDGSPHYVTLSSSTDTYSATLHKLASRIPLLEEDTEDVVVRQRQRKTNMLVNKLRIGREKAVKAIVQDSTSADATPTTKWDASGAEIEKDIDNAKEAFVKQCGVEANGILIPPHVSYPVKRDPSVRELRKYTEPGLLLNGDLPPVLFGLNVVVPGAINQTANPGQTAALARIWSDDTVILFYNEQDPGTDSHLLSAQFRVMLARGNELINDGNGAPIRIRRYVDDERESEIVEAAIWQDEELVSAIFGYHLLSVLT